MQKVLYAAILWLDEFINDIAILKTSSKGLRYSSASLTIRLMIWHAQR
jgi:hypothetical protein